MTGKGKCEFFRAIRREIAERNGIEYLSAECHHKGDCLGTCSKSDAEVRFLNSELERLVREGKSVDFVSSVTDMYDKAFEEYYKKMTEYSESHDESVLDVLTGSEKSSYHHLSFDHMERELTIDYLDLSVRSYNCLKNAGIKTIEDLISLSEGELMKVRNLGKKTFDEVVEKMHSLGFDLSDDEE